MPEHSEITLLIGLFFGAGIVKGFFGIGIPPILLGVLTFIYDPRQALALMLIPIVASNARQALVGISPFEILKKHVWFLPVSSLTIFVTAYVSGGVATSILLTLTGAAMSLFAITSLIDRAPPIGTAWLVPAQLMSGVLSGLLGGMSGIWGPPMMIYLFALRLPKAELIQTIGVFFFLLSVFMALGVAAVGDMSKSTVALALALIVPVFIGMAIGEAMRKNLDDARFLRWLLIMFLALGLNLIRRGVLG
ncbi:MAG: sulfite exporter TauE/SafE family protein [Rhodobacteraceae bacterium]|nr:sulfite exporter TauE/SafE family protein [Paracoccaceae bacterium]